MDIVTYQPFFVPEPPQSSLGVFKAMADVSPSGSTVTIPNSNFVVPGLDTFNDLVNKVNAALSSNATATADAIKSVASGAAPVSSVNDLAKSVTDSNAAVKSDLTAAVADLNNKFSTVLTTVTSSQPVASAPPASNYSWLWIVGAFLIAWLIAEKKFPL